MPLRPPHLVLTWHNSNTGYLHAPKDSTSVSLQLSKDETKHTQAGWLWWFMTANLERALVPPAVQLPLPSPLHSPGQPSHDPTLHHSSDLHSAALSLNLPDEPAPCCTEITEAIRKELANTSITTSKSTFSSTAQGVVLAPRSGPCPKVSLHVLNWFSYYSPDSSFSEFFIRVY